MSNRDFESLRIPFCTCSRSLVSTINTLAEAEILVEPARLLLETLSNLQRFVSQSKQAQRFLGIGHGGLKNGTTSSSRWWFSGIHFVSADKLCLAQASALAPENCRETTTRINKFHTIAKREWYVGRFAADNIFEITDAKGCKGGFQKTLMESKNAKATMRI